MASISSSDELIRLYKLGELPNELAQYHETLDGEDVFLSRCVDLHNSGHLDLLGLVSQPSFANLGTHQFFTAQIFYGDAIPLLVGSPQSVMDCCRILIQQAGNDGAANHPNAAFRNWCVNNSDSAAAVVKDAHSGDPLATQFVTFALQATNNIDGAIEFIVTYEDERRLFGMAALGGMALSDAPTASKVLAVLEPYLADTFDDSLRLNSLLAAFAVLKQHNDAGVVSRLISSAAQNPGPGTLHGLAKTVWLHHTLLNSSALETALTALESVDANHRGTIRQIDVGLRQLLGTQHEKLALDFLTAALRRTDLKLEAFQSAAHEITNGERQRVYELLVRWLLDGDFALCSNASDLVGNDGERTFDTNVQSLNLTPTQHIFLCRKAIGFLFVRSAICCSIIVSVLRGADQETGQTVADLLFDPMLLNYGGSAREYLNSIPSNDPAYIGVQRALAKAELFYSGLDAADAIKELHPSEHQRDVVRQRIHDEMRAVHKQAESQSIFMNLVHRSTILYGKRSRTYVTDPDGQLRAVDMDLRSFSTSVELPRWEIVDPVGLDYMLRVFRAEKFG